MCRLSGLVAKKDDSSGQRSVCWPKNEEECGEKVKGTNDSSRPKKVYNKRDTALVGLDCVAITRRTKHTLNNAKKTSRKLLQSCDLSH